MSSQLPLNEREEWRRRLLRSSAALIAASFFLLATTVVSSAGLRAGIIRTFRIATARMLASKPVPTARLDVPFLKQEHALSCEAATLRMVLAYRGVTVSERELLEKIGFDPTPRRGNVWGDPDESFVGSVDGIMGKTGYGVHVKPLARVAGEYRKVEAIEQGTPQVLAAEVTRGNPVIVWGFVPGRGESLAWRTLGGKEIYAVYGEHTRVVIGYTGSEDAPTGFFVLDPIYGEQYWSIEGFMKNWEPLGRSGVIIY